MEITRKIKSMLASRQTSDLRGAGYSASALRSAWYSAIELRGAGYSASDLRSAGYSAIELRGAGYSASELLELEDSIPLVEMPYSRLLSGINAGKLKHDQSNFGPDADPKTNLCKTQMCTAGHLVNMGGNAGYKLLNAYGFIAAATLIHEKAHPGWPCQDFGNIPQEWAIAYIEEMAEHEVNGTSPVNKVAS